MPSVSVDPDELRHLGRELGAVHHAITRLSGRVLSLSRGTTGHPGLAQALGHFADDWKYALGRIGEHTGELGLILVRAADTYETVDAEVAKTKRG
jgi:hypothetical protein